MFAREFFGLNTDGFLFSTVDPSAPGNMYPMAQLAATGEEIRNLAFGVIGTVSVLQLVPLLNNTSILELFAMLGYTLLACGVMISLYIPILPVLRVAMAVLTWITSVFEAVVMIPIAALAHLSSEGDGISGGARTAWILWLNVLMRPILVVCGFVGAMLIYNAFVIYFLLAFGSAVDMARGSMGFVSQLLSYITYTVVFVAVIYTTANSTFKLLDLIPNAMMRWIGGHPDHSFEDNNDGMMFAASNMLRGMGSKPLFNMPRRGKGADKGGGPGATKGGGE
jgi:conjugal transfer/type IV secretion protein DotA/TraY